MEMLDTAVVSSDEQEAAAVGGESDRVRIFKEIADAIGMEKFNARLQEYLERAMRAAAAEALLEWGGVESVTGGSKATLGLLRGELEQTKQLLTQTQSEMKQEVLETKKEVLETKQAVRETKEEVKEEVQKTKEEVQKTKEEVLETKQELALLTTAQEEASKETKLIGGRMATLEVKMDAMLELLRGTRGSVAGSQ
jgi:chromosome segregation ATPase